MPIDYSKWKAIEVSDDEDDTHPNIDTPSLFRWRHQARLERMAEKKQKKEEIEKNKTTSNSKIEEIEKKLAGTDISEEERICLEKELAEIKEQEAKWLAKEKELEERLLNVLRLPFCLEQERLEPWNVDTIGHEAFSFSRINKVGEKKPLPKLSDEEDTKRMTNFFDQNESLIQEYGKLTTLGESEEFILEHPHLASEYTANYLTIDALNLAIDHKEAEMSNIARQCIIIQYLLELAKNMNAVPTNVNIIKAFFKKFRSADPQYLKLYTDEVAAFEERLIRRAKEKRDAALAEYEAEEKVMLTLLML
ncbi:Cdc37 Hsp90 binding domain protein [Dictyocaulus viviparus]|uniref:Hsp90 chaperone protein kinase-targeting subunit n=1 Tax=Dictyocaulus viviparus TaxID=29172 RepID=A0A0D8XRF6_DICVI|nr:Cdc37 Hsp90 binding domain protein [Dictyocaulus viviparus]